jgi:hypothetical protein
MVAAVCNIFRLLKSVTLETGRKQLRAKRHRGKRSGPAGLEAAVLSMKAEEENCNA